MSFSSIIRDPKNDKNSLDSSVSKNETKLSIRNIIPDFALYKWNETKLFKEN